MTLVQRFVGEADMADFSAFFSRHWGPGHILARDAAFARWQMPAAAHPVFGDAALAGIGMFEADALVGFIGAMPMPFNMHGTVIDGAWLCNLLAAPQTHSRGVGLKLMTAVHGLPFQVVGAVGINLAVIPLYRAMRYMTGDRVPRFVRVLDAERLAAITDGATGPLIEAARPAPAAGEGASATLAGVPEDWDGLWARIAATGYLGTHRDARFLTWRYLEHPHFRYRLVSHRDRSGALSGIAVFRTETIRDTDTVICRLIELQAVSPAAVAGLAAHVEREARAEGAILIDHYSTGHMAGALEDAGWRAEERLPETAIPTLFQPLARGRRDMNYAVRVLRRNGAEDGNAGSLLIVKSDGDQDRPN